MKIEFTDRYKALGIPYPDPKTMCKGPCEGTGMVPVQERDDDQAYSELWRQAAIKQPSDDGWHFVVCLDCNGTGK